MEILSEYVQDDGLVSFRLGGIASDGLYRVALLVRDTVSAATWLAENQTEAQALIDSGLYVAEHAERVDLATLAGKITSEIVWLQATRPLVDTATLDQLRQYLKRLMAEQEEELKAWRYVVRKVMSS